MTDETTTEQLVEIEGQGDTVQVREGRWRKRSGVEVSVSAMPTDHDDFTEAFPWWDGHETTWTQSGHLLSSGECPADLVEYIGPIEPQPQPQPEPEPDAELRIRLLKQANDSQAETIGRLLTEARDLNMEIGGLERQLLQRDARIRDLETMHAAAAQAVVDAGKENTALRNQLLAVKTELASVAADRQRLRIELDAAQQVPADSPELRQLRADLAEVIRERDTYKDAHELLVQDVNATHQRTKVMTIEAIVEWLVPIRTCGSQALATAVISNLPHIMRSLTGLEDEGIE